MNVPEKLTPLSLGLTYKSKDVTHTVIDVNICEISVRVQCEKIHPEDITDELLMHLLKSRILMIRKYKGINKLDLYERASFQNDSLGLFASIDIPEVFKDRFVDGEMIDGPDEIQEILIDLISEYSKCENL